MGREAAHPNEDLLRRAYDALGAGEVEGLLGLLTDDFVMRVPGDNALAGTYKGKAELAGLLERVMALTDGTFREEVHDVVAGTEHGIALVTHHARRGDRLFTYESVHVWHVRDGKLADLREFPDPDQFDRVWAKPPYEADDYAWGLF